MAESTERRMRLRYAGTCSVCRVAIGQGQTAIYDKATKTVRCEHHEQVPAPTPPPSQPDPDLPKLIRVRYAGSCTACDVALATGTQAFWVPGTKVMVCATCTGAEVTAALTPTAGTSAGRVADGAARAHAERLLAAYPMLGQHLVENARPTSTMHRWDRGADGERVVGRLLDHKVAARQLVVLHDRRIPGRGGNIDHIVIGPRRITVIDAKHYRGHKIRTPKRHGQRELEVDGKPAQHLIDGVAAQRRAIEDALVPELRGCVEATLAFVGADLGFGGQWSSGGVWCMTPKEAVSRAATTVVIGSWPYALDADRRAEIGAHLEAAFPAA